MSNEDLAPEGYRYEWIADNDWELLPEHDNRKCAMRGCMAMAVALLRRKHKRFASGYAWWAYCGEHLYGRKVEDGVVKFRRMIPVTGGTVG
jgi:hypothetical protein